MKPFANNRRDYAINLAEPSKKDKVLNVGISNIPEIEMEIEDKVKECWTIDLDSEKMDKASKYLKKTRLVEENIFDSRVLERNYFDKVIMLEVLEHLEEDDRAIGIISSLLKKGGVFVISVPNNNLLHILNPVKYTQHKRHYSIERLVALLRKNGFEIEHLNVVESWKLLANLYAHLFFKYILKRNIEFGVFERKGNKTYAQMNENGLDIIIRARKK